MDFQLSNKRCLCRLLFKDFKVPFISYRKKMKERHKVTYCRLFTGEKSFNFARCSVVASSKVMGDNNEKKT